MREELIKNLRRCGAGDCDKCELRTPFLDCQDDLLKQAADAIEEMNKCLDGVSADNDELCKTIEELSKPRWIPVTERLPEEKVWVLVFIREENKSFIAVSMRTDFNYWSGFGRDRNITHWMQLPELPKEE